MTTATPQPEHAPPPAPLRAGGYHRRLPDSEMLGVRFGMLLVLSEGPKKGTDRTWHCICDCGARIIVNRMSRLRNGDKVSCGCVRRGTYHARAGRIENVRNLRKVWQHMRRRCLNPADRMYPLYGGRGITVCDRWLNSFDAFKVDMWPWPAGTSIDRINNERGYEPGNCRWATQTQQSRNRRSTRNITIGDRTMCVEAWADEAGIKPSSMRERLARGITGQELLAPPKKKRPSRA